jgi:deoxyadenosine/deoxycytidine kinase
MKAKVLTIIGNIGAGKSSAAEVVVRTMGGELVPADDLFQTTDPFRKPYLDDLPRWALANETWLTLMRSRMLRSAIDSASKPWLVVDSGILMSWAYTHSHFLAGKITRAEWDLYKELFSDLTGDLYHHLHVLYLDYPLDTLMQRIKLRGREFELACYSRDYLAQIQQGIDELLKDFHRRKVDVLRVSQIEVEEFVKDKFGEKKLADLAYQHFG